MVRRIKSGVFPFGGMPCSWLASGLQRRLMHSTMQGCWIRECPRCCLDRLARRSRPSGPPPSVIRHAQCRGRPQLAPSAVMSAKSPQTISPASTAGKTERNAQSAIPADSGQILSLGAREKARTGIARQSFNRMVGATPLRSTWSQSPERGWSPEVPAEEASALMNRPCRASVCE